MLKKLSHPNIVQLVDIVRNTSQSVYLVFEYLENDLYKILRKPEIIFNKQQLKYVMKQIMIGLVYMHRNAVIHRDIKTENILVSLSGQVKFADYGLARDWHPPQFNEQVGKMSTPRYTKRVCTPYYRPPEICLLNSYYDQKVDVWSTACVFAELLTKRPLFRGQSELDQLHFIFKTLLPDDASLPTEEEWPGFRAQLDIVYPNNSFPTLSDAGRTPGFGSLRNYFSNLPSSPQTDVIDDEIISLLESMLQINPMKRPTAEQVLEHSFFKDVPEHVELDFAELVEENKNMNTFTKPKQHIQAMTQQVTSSAQAQNDQPTETVDLTQKPSLLSGNKRTAGEANIDLTEEQLQQEEKKPKLI